MLNGNYDDKTHMQMLLTKAMEQISMLKEENHSLRAEIQAITRAYEAQLSKCYE